MSPSPLAPWVARLFAWLVPAFLLWHFASGPIAALQAAIAQAVANTGFPGLVSGWERDGAAIEFATRLHATAGGRVGDLVFGVNARLYSYGLPLYAALCLATDPRRWPGFLAGAAALLPVAAAGVAFDLLQQVFVAHGAIASRDYLPTPWERNAIALGYQVSAVLLPTAAPVLVWGAVHRRFLAPWLRDRRDIPQPPC